MKEKLNLKLKLKKPVITKKTVKKSAITFFWLTIGCAITAFSIMAVMIPNGLATGGITGIARILQDLTHIDYALINYVLTLVIVIITWIVFDFSEVRKILLVSVMFPAMLFVFEHLIPVELLAEKDILLASVFCGIFTGIGNGIVFNNGYSYGGTDTVAKILRKKLLPHMSQNKIMTSMNMMIIIGCAFVFGRNIALYALITQWICKESIDLVLHGFHGSVVQLEIITTKKNEICDYVMHELHRGVSVHEVEGAYSGVLRSELRLLCSPREEMMLKKKLRELDPESFTTAIEVDNVWGRGFDPLGKD